MESVERNIMAIVLREQILILVVVKVGIRLETAQM